MTKTKVKKIISIFLVIILAANFYALYSSYKSQYIIMDGWIESKEENKGSSKNYEIVTEDGNLWGCESRKYREVGDGVLVVFKFSEKENVETYELVKFL